MNNRGGSSGKCDRIWAFLRFRVRYHRRPDRVSCCPDARVVDEAVIVDGAVLCSVLL
jgi:hypothetical protein